ncbi:MAG: GAF domain-containing sensor histidine kinase [Thermoplasmata archaeon]
MTGKKSRKKGTKGIKTSAKNEPSDSNRLYLTLMHFNEAILGANEPKEVFDRVCEVAVSDGSFKFAWVGIADTADGEIRHISSAGMPPEFDFKSLLSSMAAAGHSATSVKTGKSFVSNNALEEPRLEPMKEFLAMVGAKSIASFPISKDGTPFAALILGSSRTGAFSKEVVSLLEGVTANISRSIDKYEADRKRMAAEFDLKGLNEELEKKIRQAESATMRAQTYLDFMSHDLTNILTPIMTYAEMISSDERVPIDDRKYGRVVVDYVLRAAKFISRVKNLAIAETMPIDKIESTDLRELLLVAQSEVFRRYPNKDIEIEYGYQNDEPIFVLGGNLLEGVIEEILDNAIKYSIEPRVEITVLVSQERTAENRALWKIEITDNGPGMNPQLRNALLAEASANVERLSKAIATGIPFVIRIIGHLGGRFDIGDRIPGDYSKGTKIVLTVPGYSQ